MISRSVWLRLPWSALSRKQFVWLFGRSTARSAIINDRFRITRTWTVIYITTIRNSAPTHHNHQKLCIHHRNAHITMKTWNSYLIIGLKYFLHLFLCRVSHRVGFAYDKIVLRGNQVFVIKFSCAQVKLLDVTPWLFDSRLRWQPHLHFRKKIWSISALLDPSSVPAPLTAYISLVSAFSVFYHYIAASPLILRCLLFIEHFKTCFCTLRSQPCVDQDKSHTQPRYMP